MYMFTFYTYKMRINIIKQQVMISERQKQSLTILKSYGINVSQFIRTAIAEKIKRDWKDIKTDNYNKIKY